MIELKPCPFCGKPAIIKERTEERRYWSHIDKRAPKGLKVLAVVPREYSGKMRDLYICMITKYMVMCSQTDCMGHNPAQARQTIEEAAERWNRRANQC